MPRNNNQPERNDFLRSSPFLISASNDGQAWLNIDLGNPYAIDQVTTRYRIEEQRSVESEYKTYIIKNLPFWLSNEHIGRVFIGKQVGNSILIREFVDNRSELFTRLTQLRLRNVEEIEVLN